MVQRKYCYVKLKKGDKGRYFKLKEGTTKEEYIDAKKYGIISKKTGVINRRSVKRIYKKIGKKGEKIEESLGSGYAETTIRNVLKSSPYMIKMGYTRLLLNTDKVGDGKPIVRDKELLEILTREENVIKYKHRLQFKFTIKGERDEELAKLQYIQAGKTLGEVIGNVKSHVKIGMDIENDSPEFLSELKKYGITGNITNTGRVRKVDVKMIFMKGKVGLTVSK